jgi:transcriptional antiterminator RfaH
VKGKMHSLWGKTSSKTHSVASSYKTKRPVREDVGPPRPAAIAERLEPIGHRDGRPVYPRWTVMHTGPKQEFAAVSDLKRDGYAAYCPVITRWVRHGHKRTIRHIPLFPRYIFVGLKPGAQRSLNACKWGKTLALNKEDLPSINPAVVYGLSDHQAAGVWDEAKAEAIRVAEATRIRRANEVYKAGDMVMVQSDVFDGFGAQVVRAGDDERVQLLMNILGRETIVHVTLDDIKPAA